MEGGPGGGRPRKDVDTTKFYKLHFGRKSMPREGFSLFVGHTKSVPHGTRFDREKSLESLHLWFVQNHGLGAVGHHHIRSVSCPARLSRVPHAFHACIVFIFLSSVTTCQYTVIIVKHLVQPKHSQMVVCIGELILVMDNTLQHIVVSLFMERCKNSSLHYTLLSRLFRGKATVDPEVTVWSDLHRVVTPHYRILLPQRGRVASMIGRLSQ